MLLDYSRANKRMNDEEVRVGNQTETETNSEVILDRIRVIDDSNLWIKRDWIGTEVGGRGQGFEQCGERDPGFTKGGIAGV
uniref:Uncharacterized protein n=1 Tax=Vespula pensylvanica TaxID=30213 RepID=A0A834N725_VESPE|nr:hypothetical protein H0235_016128 [Vespula pensylvanica]